MKGRQRASGLEIKTLRKEQNGWRHLPTRSTQEAAHDAQHGEDNEECGGGAGGEDDAITSCTTGRIFEEEGGRVPAFISPTVSGSAGTSNTVESHFPDLSAIFQNATLFLPLPRHRYQRLRRRYRLARHRDVTVE